MIRPFSPCTTFDRTILVTIVGFLKTDGKLLRELAPYFTYKYKLSICVKQSAVPLL